MKRLAERDPLDDDYYHPNKRQKYDHGDSSHTKKTKSSQASQWRVPDSHQNMPQIIRKEVREFHQISLHVSEPPRVNLGQTQ